MENKMQVEKLVANCTSMINNEFLKIVVSNDQLDKLIAADWLCHKGSDVYIPDDPKFIKRVKNNIPKHFYMPDAVREKGTPWGTFDIGQIRDLLIKKFGQDEFNLRMEFVKNPFPEGFKVLVRVLDPLHSSERRLLIGGRGFEREFLNLKHKEQEELLKVIADCGDSLWFWQFFTPEAKGWPLFEDLQAQVIDLKEVLLRLAATDPNGPMTEIVNRCANA